MTKECVDERHCITELKKQVLPRLLRPLARGKTLLAPPAAFFSDVIEVEPCMEKSFLIDDVTDGVAETLLVVATLLTWSTASCSFL